MLAYALRLIDRAQLKEINHRLLLGGTIHPRDLQAAGRQLRRRAGRAATSGPARARRSPATRPRAAAWSSRPHPTASTPTRSRERLGFDDVIGTGSIIGLDERVHAKIAGENCYGPAKLRMIADWVEKSGLKGVHGHVRFYSDHVSDQPAFEWADEPVAVNPHGKLRRLAEERGWAIEDWG